MNAGKVGLATIVALVAGIAGAWVIVSAAGEPGVPQTSIEPSPTAEGPTQPGLVPTQETVRPAGNSLDQKSDEPVRRAPPTAQVPDEIVEQELPELPYVYRDAFRLVPAGTPKNNPTEFGDERDTWTWTWGSATSLDELPDDDLARVPWMPNGYDFVEAVWTAGTRPDGSVGGLINIAFAFEGANLLPVEVSFGYPVKIADGRPYTMAVPGAPFQLRTVDVRGHPGVYQFPSPSLDVSGHQLLIVRDGDLTIHIRTYRGVAYSDIVAIAESILIRTVD
jgi:hypothetical protein